MRLIRTSALVLAGAAAIACGAFQPAWAPSGERLAFMAFEQKAPSLVEWSLETGEARRLPVDLAEVASFAYESDDRLLVLQTGDGDARPLRVWRVSGLRGDEPKTTEIFAGALDSVGNESFRLGFLVHDGRLWSRGPDTASNAARTAPDAEGAAQQPVYLDLSDGSVHTVSIGSGHVLGAGELGLFGMVGDEAESDDESDALLVRRIVKKDAGWTAEPFARVPHESASLVLAVGARHLATVVRESGTDRPRAVVIDGDGRIVHDLAMPWLHQFGVAALSADEQSLWVVGSDMKPLNLPVDDTGSREPRSPAEREIDITRVDLATGEPTSWKLSELAGAIPDELELIGAALSPTAPVLALQIAREESGYALVLDFRGNEPRLTEVRAPQR